MSCVKQKGTFRTKFTKMCFWLYLNEQIILNILITKFSLESNSIIYLNVNEMQVFLWNNVRKVA